MIEILQYDFAQRAVIAAVLIGLVAPIIGVFLPEKITFILICQKIFRRVNTMNLFVSMVI
jgi:hypothetical protein